MAEQVMHSPLVAAVVAAPGVGVAVGGLGHDERRRIGGC